MPKKLSVENLLQKDVKLVEKKKLIFMIPAAILLVGLIMMGVWWGVFGSPFNLGMDFTGGYTIQIYAGTNVNEDNFSEYDTIIRTIMNEYKQDESGYGVNLNSVTRTESNKQTSIRIEYRAGSNIPKAERDTVMDTISDEIIEQLNAKVSRVTPDVIVNEVPAVSIKSGLVKLRYSIPVKSYYDDGFLNRALADSGVQISDLKLESDYKTITFNVSKEVAEGEAFDDFIKALTISDKYSATAVRTDMISGSVSTGLIISAITAVLFSLLFMLIYIVIRFEFASGIASILALLHDIIIVFIFMAIFRIEFNSTFIAALITSLGYSINNSIIIFDRVRENHKYMYAKDKNVTSNQIANKSIIETLGRSINTTLTTFIMIFMIGVICAIGGIFDMLTFASPIIVSLAAGMYSSVMIAPTIWSMLRKKNLGTKKLFSIKKEEAKSSAKEPASKQTAESN